ncbi:hypothetical protein HK101_001747 [Irineochytrium annulatum]|nr:hypothetical protein HK101_001747 [Irineochytrium annulatum]
MLAVLRANDVFTPELERQALDTPSRVNGLPLYIGPAMVGLVRFDVIPHLEKHPQVFSVSPDSEKPRIDLNASLTDSSLRTEAVELVLREWRDRELFSCLKGWRSERYSVWGRAGEVLMEVERAAAGLLGMRGYGCHLNGYYRNERGEVMMWVSRRSATKQTYPGMLDNLVGGGLPHGCDPVTCMRKECFEEAGLIESDLGAMKTAGCISYWIDSASRGLLPNLEYVFDLELPPTWKPVCQDGEVQGFMAISLDEAADRVKKLEFTPEAGLVIVDFLVRHGVLTPLNEPHFTEVTTDLRRRFPFAGPSF